MQGQGTGIGGREKVLAQAWQQGKGGQYTGHKTQQKAFAIGQGQFQYGVVSVPYCRKTALESRLKAQQCTHWCRVLAGVLIALGLLLADRRAVAWALGGATLGMLAGLWLNDATGALLGLHSYNPALAALVERIMAAYGSAPGCDGQPGLGRDPVLDGDHRKIGAVAFAGFRIDRERASRTVASAKIVDANDKKLARIERLSPGRPDCPTTPHCQDCWRVRQQHDGFLKGHGRPTRHWNRKR